MTFVKTIKQILPCRKTHYKSQSTPTLKPDIFPSLKQKHVGVDDYILDSTLVWGDGAWRPGPREPDFQPSQPIQEGNDSNFLSEKLIEPLIEAPRSTWKHTPWWTKKGEGNAWPPSPPKKGGGKTKIQFWLFWEREFILPKLPPNISPKKNPEWRFMLKCCWFWLASKLADCICITVLCLMVSNRCFLVIARWLGRCFTFFFNKDAWVLVAHQAEKSARSWLVAWLSGIPFQYLPNVHVKIVLGVPKSFNIFHKI